MVGCAAGYVLFLGWAMQRLSYDVWGALVVAPLIVTLSVPLIQRAFPNDREVALIALAGLGLKLAGSAARYWIAFDAYGGAADAGRYHEFGKALAGEIRSGRTSVLRAIPAGTGTQFVERLTATVYTMFGSSRLGGFMLFGWMAFWGAVLLIRAATIAVPGLAVRRYAILVFGLPSLVYWPSSIGKEAWMMLCLGLASYGCARLVGRGRAVRSVAFTALGLTGAAFVRPHMAGMWLAGVAVALVGGLLVRGGEGRERSRFAMVVLAGIAVVGLSFVAAFAIRYLEPAANDADDQVAQSSVTKIFEETERRSEQGGSGFETIDLNGPQTWPYAIVRTVTRPLLHEARSLAELLPAVEMTALLAAGVLGWRRFANVVPMIRRSPYVLFALAVVMMFGLAFTSIGNLGILTRQRSLVLPLLLIPWCLPPLPRRRDLAGAARAANIAAPGPGALLRAH